MYAQEGRDTPRTYYLLSFQVPICIKTRLYMGRPKTCESESRCIASCGILFNWPRCSQRDRVTMLRLDDCHCHPGREPIAQEFRFWSMPTQHCNPRAGTMCCDNAQALLENDRKKCFGLGRLRHADSSEVQPSGIHPKPCSFEKTTGRERVRSRRLDAGKRCCNELAAVGPEIRATRAAAAAREMWAVIHIPLPCFGVRVLDCGIRH